MALAAWPACVGAVQRGKASFQINFATTRLGCSGEEVDFVQVFVVVVGGALRFSRAQCRYNLKSVLKFYVLFTLA